MKLKLPNGEEILLDKNISLDEKKKVVYDILTEWNSYFEQTWEIGSTRVCLDILSNYLYYHKEDLEEN